MASTSQQSFRPLRLGLFPAPLLVFLLLITCLALPLSLCDNTTTSGLGAHFYDKTCPSFSKIVNKTVTAAFAANPRVAPLLLRLMFHDCFVRGCDASLLLDSVGPTLAEKDSGPNLSVGGYDLIDTIKTQVEAACPQVVSCADITMEATRDALTLVGGPNVPLRYGRKDGRTSLATEASSTLPSPNSNLSTLIAQFATQGLTSLDLALLSGAHTIGQSHCGVISRRLPPNNDPTLNSAYGQSLAATCSQGPSTPLPLDPGAPTKFGNQYYNNVLAGKGLFSSDAALLQDSNNKGRVQRFAQSQDNFFGFFKSAFFKLAELNVVTGNQGEVRTNCHFVNRDASSTSQSKGFGVSAIKQNVLLP